MSEWFNESLVTCKKTEEQVTNTNKTNLISELIQKIQLTEKKKPK